MRYQVTRLLLLVFHAVRDVQKFEFRLLTQQTADQQRPVENSNEVTESNVFGMIYVPPPLPDSHRECKGSLPTP